MNLPFFKGNLPDRSIPSLAGMLGGAALLVAVAVVLGGNTRPGTLLSNPQNQAAATALGDIQGVPPGFTGQPLPDYAACFVNMMRGAYGDGPWDNPVCTLDRDYRDFYSGIFSVGPSDLSSGQSVYLSSVDTPQGVNRDVDLGPAYPNCDLEYRHVDPDTGNPYCSVPPFWDYYPFTYSCLIYETPPGDHYVDIDYTDLNDDGSPECYGYNYPSTLATTPVAVGAAPVVAPGSSLTLQWSCLWARNVYLAYKGGQGWFSDGDWAYVPNYLLDPLSTGSTGTGSGFSTDGALQGSKTVAAPSDPGSYTYSVTCDGAWGLPAMTTTVVVSDTVPNDPPTVTISGNTQATIGVPDHITATFTPHGDDFLANSAINGCTTPNQPKANCQNALTDNAPVPSLGYDFIPVAPGTYYFSPAVRSNLFSDWNDYGQELTVQASCPSGQVFRNGQCVQQLCVGSFEGQNATPCSDLEAKTNSTLVDTCSQPPVACEWSCDYPYVKSGNQCVPPQQCTGPHEDPTSTPPDCRCITGYQRVNGQCLADPTLALTVNPNRVRVGGSTALSWNVKDLPGDGSITCQISASPTNALFSFLATDGTEAVWSGSQSSAPIQGQTTFTLACSNGASVSQVVTLIPTYIEK